MRLISAALGLALRKLGLFGALVLSLFLGYLLVQAAVPALRDAAKERERLEQVISERAALEDELAQLQRIAAAERSRTLESLNDRIDAEIQQGREDISATQTQLDDLRTRREDVCGIVKKVVAWVLPGNACKSAERAVEAAENALARLERNVARAQDNAAVLGDPDLSPQQKLDRLDKDGEQSLVERQIENKQAELRTKTADEESLEAAQSSWAGRVVNQWARTWEYLVAIALLVIFAPYVLRTVSYFLLMPLVTRAHKPFQLAADREFATADLRSAAAQRTLTIQLSPGEVLSARSEHVRPAHGVIRSGLLYDWRSPCISFAAGLHGLTRITGDGCGSSATLATPDDPDSYLMRIDFTDHPGVVMHPKHVVGVIGRPDLETRWQWGFHALATWQVRYIMFVGTGSLIVQGSGDVVATAPPGRPTRMDQNLLMGFDSRLTVGVNRTEVFVPYLRGRTPLVDDEFNGSHPFFWQKATADGPRNPVARTFDTMFSALGKLFGF